MIYINKNTKKAKTIINAYNYYKGATSGASLYEIYNNFSYNKYNALKYCHNLQSDLHGFGACFGGHNCFSFVYYFLFNQDGKKYLAYITKDNNYFVEVE